MKTFPPSIKFIIQTLGITKLPMCTDIILALMMELVISETAWC